MHYNSAHMMHQSTANQVKVSGPVHDCRSDGAQTQGKIPNPTQAGFSRIGTETAFMSLRNF
jgi:hypothetical protein